MGLKKNSKGGVVIPWWAATPVLTGDDREAIMERVIKIPCPKCGASYEKMLDAYDLACARAEDDPDLFPLLPDRKPRRGSLAYRDGAYCHRPEDDYCDAYIEIWQHGYRPPWDRRTMLDFHVARYRRAFTVQEREICEKEAERFSALSEVQQEKDMDRRASTRRKARG